jgi:hypothetical protein
MIRHSGINLLKFPVVSVGVGLRDTTRMLTHEDKSLLFSRRNHALAEEITQQAEEITQQRECPIQQSYPAKH